MDGEEAAALANLVAHLLRKAFSSNLLSAGLFINFGFFFLLTWLEPLAGGGITS